MLTNFRNALSLLEPRERRAVLLIMLSSGLSAVAQVVSILAIMPFIVLLANPELLESSGFLARVNEWLGVLPYRDFLVVFGVVGIVVLTLGNLFVAFEQWLGHRIFSSLRHKIETRLLQAMLRRRYEFFVAEHSARLADVVLRQVERVVDGVIGAFVSVASGIALVGLIVLLLLVVSLETTLITLAGLLLAYVAVFLLLRRRIEAHGEELTQVSAAVATTVKEMLDGVQEIKSRNAAGFFGKRFERASLALAKLEVRYGVMSYLPHFLLEAVVFSGFVAVALYFLVTTSDSGVSLSFVALYGVAVYRLIPALKSVFEGISTIHHNADAVAVVTEHAGGPAGDVPVRALPPLRDEVRLECVTYRHADSDYRQVENIDLAISRGTSICLFGPSGSGKSTILNLLAGLLQPQVGRLLCDGVPVGPDTIESWRSRIGYAPQKTWLFDDTVAANIAFGVPADDVDQDRLVEVARLANLHDFVTAALPNGYRTVIGEHGATLSGGQRQRIGIARALYHDPDILILDESFTGLDAENAEAILDHLFALPGKTLVLSSHAPTVAQRCARIATVDHGRLTPPPSTL